MLLLVSVSARSFILPVTKYYGSAAFHADDIDFGKTAHEMLPCIHFSLPLSSDFLPTSPNP